MSSPATTSAIRLERISFEALRLLVNALAPSHCPCCGVDLKLSPTTNIAPKFEKADHPMKEFHVIMRAELLEEESITKALAPAMEQLAKEIAEARLTRCALLPLHSDSYRAEDPKSNLSILMRIGQDPKTVERVAMFTIGLA